MNGNAIISFKGKADVTVFNACGDFVPCPGSAEDGAACYLAGTYCEDIDPRRVGAEELSGFFGQFVFLKHEPALRKIAIVTDRFGLFPLYVASDENGISLSTDFYALAGQCSASNTLNWSALSDMLAFNVPLGEQTVLNKVTALPAASEITIDLDTLEICSRKLWDPARLLSKPTLTLESIRDRLIEVFLEGIRLATAHHPVANVTLSGGADSRCLMAASLHIGKQTVAYSTGVPGSRALAYAAEMAELCGVRSVRNPLGADFVDHFAFLMQECSRSLQGSSFASELEAMWLSKVVPARGVLLHGGFAELFKVRKMHNFAYTRKIGMSKGSAVAGQLWSRFQYHYEQRRSCFSSACQAALGEEARNNLSNRIFLHQQVADTAGTLQLLYIEEFLGKVVKASWNMWRQHTTVMFPFAYPPLVDLILQVRTKDKLGDDFVMHLLRKTNRALAHYPDSNTGVRLGASWGRREAAHVVDYIAKRLSDPKRAFEHQDFSHWLTATPVRLDDLFNRHHDRYRVFNMRTIGELIKKSRGGDEMASRTLYVLWAWVLLEEKLAFCREAGMGKGARCCGRNLAARG